ncbi:Sua5/YciO/YrdC/YwlC family protein [Aliagarivorans taiwanensis]|uniref:Sua5/YciO/YrdC/YwlC family protein n=1 Tax=Aliagarivorans taiwanensis TaxID=561966 RepID=UPI0004050F2B|nr:Sua5/YciO/YrdC/YwlC family protein [Aliagarivorans taiwanensis]
MVAKVTQDLSAIAAAVEQGEVIAYPTEAVFGLGCDPRDQQAVETILAIKSRPVEKGMILIAGNTKQLEGLVDFSKLDAQAMRRLTSKPEQPTTWVVPAGPELPKWICGQFDTVAVRLTRHPGVCQLCGILETAIVSTSANYSGEEPARTASEAACLDGVHWVWDAPLGGANQPSQIKDIFSGKLFRA